MCVGLHVKYRSFLSDFNETWIFLTDIWKNLQRSNFMKIQLVGARGLCRRTDGHAWKCINVTSLFFRGLNAQADRVETLDLKQGCAKAGLPPSSASTALTELSKASYISHCVLELCLLSSHRYYKYDVMSLIFFFYIQGSVHRDSNWIIVQQYGTVSSLLHFCRQLYMFRVLTPIIRSSYSCNYSFWHWSTRSTTIHARCWDLVNQCQKLYLQLYELLMMGVNTRNM